MGRNTPSHKNDTLNIVSNESYDVRRVELVCDNDALAAEIIVFRI